MKKDIRRIIRASSPLWPELFLVGFVASMAILYVRFSGTRSFNFDEFSSLYAGAALLRGKALFADQVEPHFPLFNIFLSFLVGLFGFKTIVLLIARYFIMLVNGIGLIFAYRIGKMLWDKRTGLVAVCLILSSIVFSTKGIEIRHDVFNTAFNVIGAYYGLRFIRNKRYRDLIISGIFLGMAFASTQKALVWNVGIIAGLLIYSIRDKSYSSFIQLHCFYFITLLIPVAGAVSFLMLWYGEDIGMFLKYGVVAQLSFYAPFTKGLYAFPYARQELFKELIFQNHLLYALAIGGMVAVIISWLKYNSERIIIAVWAMAGVLFYVTAKRPFFQTLLPSIPPLALLAAGALSDIWRDLKGLSVHRAIAFSTATIALLFIWPLILAWSQVPDKRKMDRQVENVSYCLENLKRDDKVLCFTFNQIFFDPLFTINYYEKKDTYVWNYKAAWFEEKMIEEQCKVIINDYRTGLLNAEVKGKIGENYVPTEIGDIFIPGFVIPPGQSYAKKVWIAGDYYSPTTSLKIDGNRVQGNVMHLEHKEYEFQNLTDRRVILIYVFDARNFMDLLPNLNRIQQNKGAYER